MWKTSKKGRVEDVKYYQEQTDIKNEKHKTKEVKFVVEKQWLKMTS